MNNLASLMGYEFKKVWKRKSTWIAISFAIFVTLFSYFGDLIGTTYVEGKPYSTHYEEFKIDRANARALTGRNIDGILISEMQEAYKRVPDAPLYTTTKEYQSYARPYSFINGFVRSVVREVNDGTAIDPLAFDGTKFYELRNKALQATWKAENLSKVEISKHIEMNGKVDTPFVFQYTDGYRSVISRMYTIGIIMILTLSVCMAPVFANEYAVRTDQLILTSRYGKNKGILAKLLTSVILGLGLSVTLLLTQSIPTLLGYGFDGWNAPIQLLNGMSTYPLTILEGVLILCGMVLMVSILITSLCFFLSARLKSSSAVIVVISTFTMLCIFIRVPGQYRMLYQLVNTLPMNVMSEAGTFSDYFYVAFSKCFSTYQVVPVLYGLVSFVLLYFGYRCFREHQIQ